MNMPYEISIFSEECRGKTSGFERGRGWMHRQGGEANGAHSIDKAVKRKKWVTGREREREKECGWSGTSKNQWKYFVVNVEADSHCTGVTRDSPFPSSSLSVARWLIGLFLLSAEDVTCHAAFFSFSDFLFSLSHPPTRSFAPSLSTLSVCICASSATLWLFGWNMLGSCSFPNCELQDCRWHAYLDLIDQKCVTSLRLCFKKFYAFV